jgi:hypothetical protein
VDLVLALDEPFRSTVLLRYHWRTAIWRGGRAAFS